MFHSIDQFLYDYRFVLFFLLLFPMLWSVWVFWSVYAAPATPSTRSHSKSKRHSHRMRMQKQQEQLETQTSPGTGAIALAESDQANQSNLLDALAATEEEDDESDSQAFKYASTQKQMAGENENANSAIVNELVGNVTDKVAAQIEALTGEPLDQQNVAVDMQDMLETVQEEDPVTQERVDPQDLIETIKEDSGERETIKPEGEHTAAIRKASKMEEIGFHRPSEMEDEEELEASVLNSPEIADLGAKHIARITELGLNDGVEADKERMRTAQLDDILNRLDAALENPEEAKPSSASNTFSTASTQLLDVVEDDEITKAQPKDVATKPESKTENGIPSAEVEPAAQIETAQSDAVDREELKEAVEEEADDFFGGLEVVVEDRPSAVNPDDVTVREESDHGDTNSDQEAATMEADLSDEDPSESFNLADIAAAIEENIDEQDQMDTVKLAQQEAAAAAEQATDEQDGIETIAVPKTGTDRIDPNLETLKEDDEADLPAWARADSFDEDLDEDGDEKPKQENLFD